MAKQSLTIQDALEVAIREEIKARNLYLNLSKKVASSATRNMLEELAEQELGHRKLLENVVTEGSYDQLGEAIPQESRGIADFLVETEIGDDASPQEVMIFAINAEIKAFNFYNDLEKYFSESDLKNLFSRLAAEEQGHKIKLEDEYEQHFMRDN
jgi:rubrerythrin